jgi:uncharacterized UPF0160 family protein
MPMSLFKKKIKVVTHSGDFHADDVFACATLSLWVEKNNCKLEIIRDRDIKIVEQADIAVDVGMDYDPNKNKFDHHQKEGAGKRENSIPYASFGLVWKKYGTKICESKDVADRIDANLVMPVDARDNGVNITKVNELGVIDHRTSNMICNFNPTIKEDKKLSFKYFEKALNFAKEILLREMAWAEVMVDGEKETQKAIEKQNNPGILILEQKTEWHEAVAKNKNIKFVVYKHGNGKDWCVQSGRDDLEDYHSDRANLPEAWFGLREGDLVRASGIEDASFCTNGGWFAVAKTKEGAIEMANKALQNGLN